MKNIFYSIILIPICLSSQTIHLDFDLGAIGIIYTNDTARGTGFAITPKEIVTCWHVISNQENIKYLSGNKTVYNLSVVGKDTLFDIAILKALDSVCTKCIPLSASEPIFKINDDIGYVGFDIQNSLKSKKPNINAEKSNIDSIQQISINGNTFQEIYFNGRAMKGYSGAPIFNRSSQLLGILKAGKLKPDGLTEMIIGRVIQNKKLDQIK